MNRAEAITEFWSINASISKTLDAALGTVHGIGLTEYMILHQLAQAPTQTARRIDLANAIQRTASGVTRLLKPMEKIGLVEKELNPRDARVSLVKLSKAGANIYRDASKTVEQQSNHILRRINASDLKVMATLLTDIDS